MARKQLKKIFGAPKSGDNHPLISLPKGNRKNQHQFHIALKKM
jgi:hypothetical protein